MSNPIAYDVKVKLLEDSSTPFSDDESAAWSIHISKEPERPKNVISVYATGGKPPALYFDTSHPSTEYPSFQVRVRGTDYMAVQDKMQEVRDAIEHNGNFLVTDIAGTCTYYMDIIPTTIPIDLPADKNNLYITVMSFYALREERRPNP